MRWVSIDPGIKTGLTFWNEDKFESTHAVTTATTKPDIIERIYEISEAIDDLIQQSDIRTQDPVKEAHVERPEFFLSKKGLQAAAAGSMQSVAYIFGGITAALSRRGIEVYDHTPKHWKGQTPKKQFIKFISRRAKEYGITTTEPDGSDSRISDDQWDSIGLGLWHLGLL